MRPMRIDPAGWPFILGALLPGLVLVLLGRGRWSVVFFVLAGFFVFFFRDPDRAAASPSDADVLSPADGRVVVAGEAEAAAAPPGAWRQISIFLSPMDVHVNRVPIAGRVTRVEYRPGKFLPAYRSEAAAENERNEIWIEHRGRTIIVRQVVGILARRIVCRVREGEQVEAGQRYGVMKFGSRIDLYLPPDASLRVGVGDKVVSGVTVLARLAAAGDE